MKDKYFDSKRDAAIIVAGGFVCEGCFVAKHVNEQSPDLRYCQSCYGFILFEAGSLPPTKRPKWIPRQLKIVPSKQKPVSRHPVLNMST